MFIALDKVHNQQRKQAIIVVRNVKSVAQQKCAGYPVWLSATAHP
jgi:hypothetical protein